MVDDCVKSGLFKLINDHIKTNDWSQREVMKCLAISQSKASFLMNNEYEHIAYKWLFETCLSIGFDINIIVKQSKSKTGTISLTHQET